MSDLLISPHQLELAHAHLLPWLGSRSRVSLDEATAATQASMAAASVPLADRAAAAPSPIATLLKLKGFFEIRHGARDGAVFVRNGSQSAERARGLSYARAWRQRTKAEFDALFGAEDEA